MKSLYTTCKTSDGIEFFPQELNSTILVWKKDFENIFEEKGANPQKLLKYLETYFKKEDWGNFVELNWKLSTKKNYYVESKMKVQYIDPVNDLRFVHKLGKTVEKDRNTYQILINAINKKWSPYQSNGIVFSTLVYPNLSEPAQAVFLSLINKTKLYNLLYPEPKITSSFYAVPDFRWSGDESVYIGRWGILPGLPSRADKFLELISKFEAQPTLLEELKLLDSIRDLNSVEERTGISSSLVSTINEIEEKIKEAESKLEKLIIEF